MTIENLPSAENPRTGRITALSVTATLRGFGSPTFFVGGDMYFGNDRLPLIRDALTRLSGIGDAATADRAAVKSP